MIGQFFNKILFLQVCFAGNDDPAIPFLYMGHVKKIGAGFKFFFCKPLQAIKLPGIQRYSTSIPGKKGIIQLYKDKRTKKKNSKEYGLQAENSKANQYSDLL